MNRFIDLLFFKEIKGFIIELSKHKIRGYLKPRIKIGRKHFIIICLNYELRIIKREK